MSRTVFWAWVGAWAGVAACAGGATQAPRAAPARRTEPHYFGAAPSARSAWFREAKFGLFIHWGLYAIPAGEWKGKEIAGIGEWIMNRAKIPVKEYERLAAQFNPAKFNAAEWVRIAKAAGMKYIVITSKHHDGFALFKSAASPYNIVDATPFKRDVLKELADACAKEGLRLGFYYSQSQDWHEPDGAGNTWDFAPNAQKDFDKYLREKAEPQVRELLAGYGPVALIWFDTPLMMSPDRARRFGRLCRELQPGCLINGRLYEDLNKLRDGKADMAGRIENGMIAAGQFDVDYMTMRDNGIPPRVVPGVWETPATLNDTWGFKKNDHHWKSADELVFKLVDIVSKGGNYLLNVGPTAEGLIPEPSVDRLRKVGEWLGINGEAVYGAGPSPFGHEFGGTTAAKDEYGREQIVSGARDWRCTTQSGRLYFHLFKWPAGMFEVTGVKGKAKRAHLLADSARTALTVKQDGERLTVALPAKAPDAIASVLCVETE